MFVKEINTDFWKLVIKGSKDIDKYSIFLSESMAHAIYSQGISLNLTWGQSVGNRARGGKRRSDDRTVLLTSSETLRF